VKIKKILLSFVFRLISNISTGVHQCRIDNLCFDKLVKKVILTYVSILTGSIRNNKIDPAEVILVFFIPTFNQKSGPRNEITII